MESGIKYEFTLCTLFLVGKMLCNTGLFILKYSVPWAAWNDAFALNFLNSPLRAGYNLHAETPSLCTRSAAAACSQFWEPNYFEYITFLLESLVNAVLNLMLHFAYCSVIPEEHFDYSAVCRIMQVYAVCEDVAQFYWELIACFFLSCYWNSRRLLPQSNIMGEKSLSDQKLRIK